MLPKHIGFIMDGNGRWAVAHGLSRDKGYAYGVNALLKVASQCEKRGVEAISAYAFSTENIARPDGEVSAILDVVKRFNNTYDGDMRVLYMGDIDALPESVAESVEHVERHTADNRGMIFNVALNYGARSDIVHAAKLAYDEGEFSERSFEDFLSTRGLPPLDLIVRTGGEKRLSNFMLYEAAYAELVFLDKLWPDMTESDVDDLLDEFETRNRKFGR